MLLLILADLIAICRSILSGPSRLLGAYLCVIGVFYFSSLPFYFVMALSRAYFRGASICLENHVALDACAFVLSIHSLHFSGAFSSPKRRSLALVCAVKLIREMCQVFRTALDTFAWQRWWVVARTH